MPGLPIPDDWDGVSWYQRTVCWPNSTSWRSILNGQLTQPEFPFFWDKSTGDLDDVLYTFEQIIDINFFTIGDLSMPCSLPRQLNFADEYQGFSLANNGASGVAFTDTSGPNGLSYLVQNNNLTPTAIELYFYTRILETPYIPGDYIQLLFSRSSSETGFPYTSRIKILSISEILLEADLVVPAGDISKHTNTMVADIMYRPIQVNFELIATVPASSVSEFFVHQALFSRT